MANFVPCLRPTFRSDERTPTCKVQREVHVVDVVDAVDAVDVVDGAHQTGCPRTRASLRA